MYNQEKLASVSEDIKAKLLSGDEELMKTAGLAASEYFRTEIRENGIRRQITPPTTVTRENFDTVEDTDFPVMFVEIAPKSAGARKVSFETGPRGNVIHGKKARVEFARIMTEKYSIDKIRLETYKMPILDIFYDLMLKDIMDVEDEVTLGVDNDIVGTIDTVNDEMGCCRYVHAGPLSRDAMVHLKKGMKVAPGNLQPAKFLMNDLTHCDFGVFGRDVVGGDMAQEMFVNGVTLTKVQGVDTVVTTKKNLVKADEVFIYTDPRYYGGFYTYKDVAMVVDEKDDIWLTFFAHETVGASVINAAGVAKALLNGTLKDWYTGQ